MSLLPSLQGKTHVFGTENMVYIRVQIHKTSGIQNTSSWTLFWSRETKTPKLKVSFLKLGAVFSWFKTDKIGWANNAPHWVPVLDFHAFDLDPHMKSLDCSMSAVLCPWTLRLKSQNPNNWDIPFIIIVCNRCRWAWWSSPPTLRGHLGA